MASQSTHELWRRSYRGSYWPAERPGILCLVEFGAFVGRGDQIFDLFSHPLLAARELAARLFTAVAQRAMLSCHVARARQPMMSRCGRWHSAQQARLSTPHQDAPAFLCGTQGSYVKWRVRGAGSRDGINLNPAVSQKVRAPAGAAQGRSTARFAGRCSAATWPTDRCWATAPQRPWYDARPYGHWRSAF